MNIAQQIWMQHQAMKAARCWAGYEPVPGSKPYTNGSCRPAGSKKTQAEMKNGGKEKAKEKKSADECCGSASVPEHTSQEPTTQIKPKPAVISHSKQMLTSDAANFGAAIKQAIAGEGAAENKYNLTGEKKTRLGQSVFTHVEKKDEEELEGRKPSHETSKHVKVTRAEPEDSEDLRPEAVFPDMKSTVD